jgi:V-type H+-transporting ATPase subunit G
MLLLVIVKLLLIGMSLCLQVLGSKGDMEAKIEAGTRQKIQDLNSNVQRNKEEAIGKLLTIILDIKPELHENLRL